MKRVERVADPRQVDAFAEELRHEAAMLAIHDRIERLATNAKISIGVRSWLAREAVEDILAGTAKFRVGVSAAQIIGFAEALVALASQAQSPFSVGASRAGVLNTIAFRRPVPFGRAISA